MTTPDGQIPPGSITGYGRWGEVQDRTRQDWEAEQQAAWDAQWKKTFDVGTLAKGFMNAIANGLKGLFNPNPDNPFLSGIWEDMFNQTKELEDHQNQLQILDGVRGYAHSYMPSGTSFNPGSSWVLCPFTAQVGPQVGAEITAQGRIKLHSQGLWRADAQIFWSWDISPQKNIYMDIVVRRPDGTEYARRQNRRRTADTSLAGTDNHETQNGFFTFTVPAAGYTVEVMARTGASAREVLTGLGYTGFSLIKMDTREED